jgi:nucleoside-diphosphate-sugar epimerase
VQLVQGTVHDDATLGRLPPDLDAIVYAISPEERSDRAYEQAYPLGVARVIAHYPGSRFLFVSSTSVYAQDDGSIVTEASPALGKTDTAKRLRQAEDLALTSGSNAVVVRSSGIYGPRRTTMVARLCSAELNERTREIWTNRIHREDLAGVLHSLLEAHEAAGVYLASDATSSTLGQIQDWLRAQPQAKFLVPDRRLQARARLSRRLESTRLEELGYSLQYPSFKEGYQEILDKLPQAFATQMT